MNTIEFKGMIDPNGQIIVPPDVAREVPAGEQLQVALRGRPAKATSGGMPAAVSSKLPIRPRTLSTTS